MESLEIKPFEGFGEIELGMLESDVIQLLGQPDDSEVITEDDSDDSASLTVTDYFELGVALYFEDAEDDDKILVMIEVENHDAVMFGRRIFKMKKDTLVKTIHEQGFTDIIEENDEDEVRVIVQDALSEFIFEDNDLLVVRIWAEFEEDESENGIGLN